MFLLLFFCMCFLYSFFFFFFKQKTAYEITYGDWSSDVCSSDNDTAYEITYGDWSSDVCSSDLAAGGARSVHSVDLSQGAIDTVAANLAHNADRPAVRGCHAMSTVGDAFQVMERLRGEW